MTIERPSLPRIHGRGNYYPDGEVEIQLPEPGLTACSIEINLWVMLHKVMWGKYNPSERQVDGDS